MKIARLLIILSLAFSAFAADINGKWKASIEGPDDTIELVFNFEVKGGKITGNVTSSRGEGQITDGKLDGDKITFTVTRDDFKIVYNGEVSGNEMKLKGEFGDRSFELTAKRQTS